MKNREDDKTIKLGLTGIKFIKKPAESYLHKIDSLLVDHYEKNHVQSEENLLVLMELRVSAQVLVSYLGELCDQAEEAGVTCLYLFPEEVKLIASLTKGLYGAVNSQTTGINLRDH